MITTARTMTATAPRVDVADVVDLLARATSYVALAFAIIAVAVVWPVAEATRYLLERAMGRAR